MTICLMGIVPDLNREDVSPLISADLPRASCSRTNPSIWQTICEGNNYKNIKNFFLFKVSYIHEYIAPKTHKPELLNLELKPPN